MLSLNAATLRLRYTVTEIMSTIDENTPGSGLGQDTLDNAKKYKPLPHRHIRLLTRYREDGSDTFTFKFIPAYLDDEAPYLFTAISYTWGDPYANSQSLLVDDIELTIPQSSAAVIRHFTKCFEDFTIWIDAVCINQEDLQEKGVQVGYMKDVYQGADQVFIWLGDEEADSTLAFEQLRKLGAERPETTPIEGVKSNPECRKAMYKLFSRPWFNRVWVIQELALGRNVVVASGKDRVDWNVFARALSQMTDSVDSHVEFFGPSIPSGVINVETMSFVRDLVVSGTPPSMEMVLRVMLTFQATNPSDKVFGLLGLIADGDDPAFEPDYTLYPQEVYLRCITAFVERGHLQFLSQAGIGLPRAFSDLMSWVPDFSISMQAAQSQPRRVFSAAGDSSPDAYVVRQTQLVVKGSIIDEVEHIAPDGPLEDCFKDLMLQAKTLQPYPTGESWHEVVWRTSIKDVWVNKRAPADLGQLWRCFATRLDTELPGESCGFARDECKRMHQDKFEELLSSRFFGSWQIHFTTKSGYVGLGYVGMNVGDRVAIILGLEELYLLRNEESTYRLVGQCYVHGLMDGEGMKEMKPETIVLN